MRIIQLNLGTWNRQAIVKALSLSDIALKGKISSWFLMKHHFAATLEYLFQAVKTDKL